jgi:hypothetical protein
MFLEDPDLSPIRSQFKHFGGVEGVAELMGVRPATLVKAHDGHYVLSHYEWVVDNLLHVHKVPHEPSPKITSGDKRRGDFLVGDTYIEVAGFRRDSPEHADYFHRLQNKLKLYERLGHHVIVINREDFDDRDSVLNAIRPLISRYGVRASSQDIDNAFKAKVAPSATPSQSVYPSHFGKQWPNVEALLNKIIAESGHFPTAEELCTNGESRLVHWIRDHHGGLNAVRKKMGYKPIQYPDSHWGHWPNVEELLLPVCRALGHFPTPEDFKQGNHGLPNIMTALRTYWRGNEAVAKKLGVRLKRELGLPRRRPKPPADEQFCGMRESEFDEEVRKIRKVSPPTKFEGRKFAATPALWASHLNYLDEQQKLISPEFDQEVEQLRQSAPPKATSKKKADATPTEWASHLNYWAVHKAKKTQGD